MTFNAWPLLAATLLPVLALSAPAGSKHNIYLVQCDPTECPSFICDSTDTITAAAYFSTGPVTEGTTRVSTPTALGRLTGFKPAWEGTKRSVRLGTAGTFTSNISSTAKTAQKGDIAGDATLGSEPFVCFKDGSTKFNVNYDDGRYTCTTDYWCPSVDVGSAPAVRRGV